MHERIDKRSLAMHAVIAERLRRDPSLLHHARVNLRRWRATCSPRVAPAFEEWEAILDGDFTSLLDLLVSPDERATRLRQSSPFAGPRFISPKERADIFRRHREPRTA